MIEFRTLGTVSLRGRDGASLDTPVSGSKRLALLAYLALARPRGLHRRDTLLPLLYPDSDQKRGRGALRNLLHQIRASLGADVIVSRGSEEIGIAEGALWCDALAFEQALKGGEHRRALELYGGDLLEGFHAPDVAPGFEHWLDDERTRLRSMATEAAWTLADEQEASGTLSGAIHWGHRAVSLAPLDEAAFQRLLRLLERAGDRTPPGVDTHSPGFGTRPGGRYGTAARACRYDPGPGRTECLRPRSTAASPRARAHSACAG